MNMRNPFGPRWFRELPFDVLPRQRNEHPPYREADPAVIGAALRRSQLKPTGNWYAFAASRDVREARPFGGRVAGIEIVAWRDRSGELRVGPRSCPHLGADLATGVVQDGTLICPWHGLKLDGSPHDFGWCPLPSHDDGALVWVRLDKVGGEEPLDKPVIPARPTGDTLTAVTYAVGACEPADIIANRLDPWHAAPFHPYSFAAVDVVSTPTEEDDRYVVAVTFHVGRLGAPVRTEFMCPDARTIVMRILDGEGASSTVETHATPLGVGPDGRSRSAVLEAVFAHSDRRGFKLAARVAPLVTPLMRHAANRLWRDDLTYAERLYQLRTSQP